jgi:ABC-2 type transport system permease protein
MKLVFVHARAMTIELVRYPAFSVPTLGFPALFFLLFVASRHERNATLLLASFAGVALLAVSLFQFGVGVAAERETPWEQFLRNCPRTRPLAARVPPGRSSVRRRPLVALTAVANTDAHLTSSGGPAYRNPDRRCCPLALGSRSANYRRAAHCRRRTSSICSWRLPAGWTTLARRRTQSWRSAARANAAVRRRARGGAGSALAAG